MRTLYNNIKCLVLCLLLGWSGQAAIAQDFDPTPPIEPGDVVYSRLYLVSDPVGACTFDKTSGASYKVGSQVTVKATPAARCTFVGWYQENLLLSTSLTYVVEQMPYHDMTLTARFEREPDPSQYVITATVDDALSGTVTGSGTYTVGNTVTLKATAKSSLYQFSHWTKNGTKTDLPYTFSFTLQEEDGNLDFVAYFDYNPASPAEPNSGTTMYSKLYLESDPTGACTFSRTSGATAQIGSSVSVKATALEDYTLRGWYQGNLLLGTEATYTVQEMSYHDMTLTARFDYTPISYYKVTAMISAEGAGTVTCTGSTTARDGKYKVGSTMTLKATAAQYFRFLYWIKNGVKTDLQQNFAFTLQEEDGDLDFVACFEYDPTSPGEPDKAESQPEVVQSSNGDLNGDHTIDTDDMQTVVEVITGTKTDYVQNQLDANGDEKIDIYDIVKVAEIINNSTPTAPSAEPDEEIEAAPFIAQANSQSSFSIMMNNELAYTAMQFDIQLPDGMTLQEADPMSCVAERFSGNTSVTRIAEGHYRVVVYNAQLQKVKGKSGSLVNLNYQTSAYMNEGVYPIVMSDVKLATDSDPSHGTTIERTISFVTVGTPATDNNVLYYLGDNVTVPSFVEEALANTTNVVVNGTCKNMVITDGKDLNTTADIQAALVSYQCSVSESVGMKTLVLPFDTPVPEGFTAYEASSVENNCLNLSRVENIRADVPVILCSPGTALFSGGDVKISATNNAQATDGKGVLVGTYTKIKAPVGSYVMQNKSTSGVGFYRVGNSQPYVGAFRAYIAPGVIESASAIRFNFIDDEVTGIENLQEVKECQQYFNLSGQETSDPCGAHLVKKGRNAHVIISK